MKNSVRIPRHALVDSPRSIHPVEPLWKRAPTQDENGKLTSDFMMVIPGLKSRTDDEIEETLIALEQVFSSYPTTVLFADLNLKMNLLWISVRPVPGISRELAAAIHQAIPEAQLIADQWELLMSHWHKAKASKGGQSKPLYAISDPT